MKKIDFSILTFILISLACFTGGMLLPELIKMNTGSYAGFFSLYCFAKFQQSDVMIKDVFLYILSVRMKWFLFLWMSCFTGMGFYIHSVLYAWVFCSFGMLLRLFLIRKGLEGGILFLCCLVPQWILYAIAGRKELSFCLHRFKGEEGKRKDRYLLFLNLLGIIIGGCVCETYLGLQIQKKIWGIFL